MKKIRLGVICPSEIAYRRFMPALQQIERLEFVGLAVNSALERFGDDMPDGKIVNQTLNRGYEKAKLFIDNYGGKIFESYEAIISSDEIDALYIPLPPALHFIWSKKALESGKHVLVEKPATISLKDTEKLIKIANERELAFHENYMFVYHEQLNYIDQIIDSGELGDIRLYRIYFGFPMRAANDFRYNKKLGGGALIDAGGYTIRYATSLLGDSVHVAYAQLNYKEGFDVDVYGSGALINSIGTTAQIAFGMDNNYKCELEVWGSKASLYTGRILTAPAGFSPEVIIRKNNEDEKRKMPADDAFKKSIERFVQCIEHEEERKNDYKTIRLQSKLMNDFMQMAENVK